jgi:hypothetical protein
LVQDRLEQAGFRVVNEAFGLGRNGNDMFGLFEIASTADSDFAQVIGLRGSHVKKLSRGLVAGTQVFVCDNLAFHGEIEFSRRHTGNILEDLGDLITNAISKIKGMKEVQDVRFDAYKSRTLYTSSADHLIVEMLRQGIINTQRVEKVVAEWDKPSHDEFQKHGRTAWRLFNAATEALKGSNVIELPTKTQKLQRMIDEVIDIDLPELAVAA